MSDIKYWLALLFAPGLGVIKINKLIEHYGSPKNVIENHLPMITASGFLTSATIDYLKHPDWNLIEKNIRWSEAANHHIIPVKSPHYPQQLKEIPDPPPVLFINGNVNLLAQNQIAIIGSRNPSYYGIETAKKFATALASYQLIITSGLATGIDGTSHQAALDIKQKTIAVLGSGLDRIYPRRHQQLAQHISDNGALVSEFPITTPPLSANFPRRNRIICGLSLGTLVIEATLRSGSLITARLANEQGKEIFAIPGSINNPLSSGCHKLIRDGAKLVENVKDILEELIPVCQISSNGVSLTEPTQQIGIKRKTNEKHDAILHIIEQQPTSIDIISQRAEMSIQSLSSLLLVLELQGKITSVNGCYHRKNDPS